jgi:FkbM family methyltransferase
MQAPQWLFKALRAVERAAAYGQGKGYGSGTVKREVALAASLLRAPPKLAVDIGGHRGRYTRALRRRFPDLEIHVFEPSRTNVATLHDRHGHDANIVIHRCAVSNRCGRAPLYGEQPGSGLASLHQRRLDHYGMAFDRIEIVPTIRFVDYWETVLHRRTMDIVKMDIEGHELSALDAFGDALAATKLLQFEFGGTNIDSRTYFQDFFYLLRDAGFELFRISPLGLERIGRYREADEFFFTINYLAVNLRF